jgi:hypothetical protein
MSECNYVLVELLGDDFEPIAPAVRGAVGSNRSKWPPNISKIRERSKVIVEELCVESRVDENELNPDDTVRRRIRERDATCHCVHRILAPRRHNK